MIFRENNLNDNQDGFKILLPDNKFVHVTDFQSLLEVVSSNPKDMLEILVNNNLEPKENNGLKIINWPDKIIRIKKCNCVDISIFMHYYFNHVQIPHYIVFLGYTSILNINKGHAMAGHCIPIFKFSNGYWIFDYFDNRFYDIYGPFSTVDQVCKAAVNYYLVLFRSLIQNTSYNPFTNPIDDYMIGDYIAIDHISFNSIHKSYDKAITQASLIKKYFNDQSEKLKQKLYIKAQKEFVKYNYEEKGIIIPIQNIFKFSFDFSNVSLKYLNIANIKRLAAKYFKEK